MVEEGVVVAYVAWIAGYEVYQNAFVRFAGCVVVCWGEGTEVGALSVGGGVHRGR